MCERISLDARVGKVVDRNTGGAETNDQTIEIEATLCSLNLPHMHSHDLRNKCVSVSRKPLDKIYCQRNTPALEHNFKIQFNIKNYIKVESFLY